MSNILDKIKLSGVTYDIVDSTAIHSLDGYWTSGQTSDAITAATNALAESIAEQHYQTSGDVQNAISGKADSSTVDTLSGTVTAHTSDTDIHVTTSDKETWNAKADVSDIPSVTGYADSVKYNSTSKYVEFYHGGTGGTKVFEYDASPFLIDGMVQNVEIKDATPTETLTFVSDEDFKVGIVNPTANTFIFEFNDSSYLNECSISLYDTTDESGNYAEVEWANGNIHISGSISATATTSGNVVTITTSSGIASVRMHEIYYPSLKSAKIEYPSVTCLVISFNTDAGKQDINIPLTEIFDPSNYYTKAEIDAELSGKAESSAVTEEIAAAVSGKVDTDTYTAYTAATDAVLTGKADSSTVESLSGTVTAHTANTDIHVTTSDKSTWSGKQDALVSGTNIKTINNESILGSGNINVQTLPTVSGTTLVFS